MRQLWPCWWARQATLAVTYLAGLVQGLVFGEAVVWEREDDWEGWDRWDLERSRSA